MPKPVYRFCIPFNEKLEIEDGWLPGDKKGASFVCFRFHFAGFRFVDPNPVTHFGESVDTIVPRKGVKIGSEIATSYTIQTTDVLKSVEGSLIENSVLAGLASELASQIGVPSVANLNAKLTSTIQNTLKTQFSTSFEVNRTRTITEQISFKQTFGFDAETEGREALVCPQYRKESIDLHLTFIDYLRVEYRRETLGLRKIRRKSPELGRDGRARNILAVKLPLVSIDKWKLLPSLGLKWRGEVFDMVEDPLDISVDSPRSGVTPFLDLPSKPSLYQLSNTAFPLRWVKRKGPWTEDDLKQAELDEARNTAWWYESGPGRNRAEAS